MHRKTTSTGQYARGSTGSAAIATSSSAANLLGSNQVVFCVNSVLFHNCGQLLAQPSGLTTSSIMRLQQVSSNLTSISLANWKEITSHMLGLSDHTTYSVFDVFYAMSGGCMQATPSYYGNFSGPEQKTVEEFRHENNRALLNKMGGTVDETRWPVASTSRQVSLPGLLIFLLTQLLLERPPRLPLGEVSQEFILTNVRQYLHDYITAVAATRQGRVTIADALELRILLREFVNGVEQPFGTSIGFLWPRTDKTIDIAILSQFIRPRIVHPREVAGAASMANTVSNAISPFPNNIAVMNLAETVYMPGPNLFPESAFGLMSSSFTIAECVQTRFYVASVLPHTRLSSLSNCTVVLGPVSGVLCIDRCVNCSITALCGTVIVSNSRDVNLFLCANTPPVLAPSDGANTLQNVRFAPYNTYYSTLEEHLALSGISPKLNLWNAGLPSQRFILPPEEFVPVTFPLQSETNPGTVANPCTLPQPYQDAINRRVQKFQEISRDLQNAYAQLQDAGRRDLADSLRGKIHSMFMDWLQQSGQGSGLLDLFQHGGRL